MLLELASVATLLAVAAADIVVYTQEIPHMIADEFRDMPSVFGEDLPLEGLRGFLAAGAPEDGCSALAAPPTIDNFTGKWIVILARYNCSFEVKVRNAQAAGYDCAIVHNVNSSDLETMSAKNPEGIIIPSVFVGSEDGEKLMYNYSFNQGYYILIDGDQPFNINMHLLLPFAIVVALCLLVMIVCLIVKCIKDRRRARRHRLPNRSLRKIPTCKFSKGDPYDTCAICLDDYQDGERLRVLPCAHAYHAKCIDPWLTQNRRVCPVCKRKVMAAGERRRPRDSDTDTDSDGSSQRLTASDQHTQGGTFEQQSENPFVRAARFMARLRARAHHAQDVPETNEGEDGENGHHPGSDVEADAEDRRPLLGAARERRPRRFLRASRSPRARDPTPQLVHSSEHSINESDPAPAPLPAPPAAPPAPPAPPAQGEIGVAALPARPAAAADAPPTHIRL